ncbi:MAG: kelch repeat-containing protein [Byssovorax sp.]
MNRILGTLFAATLLTACGVAPSGTLDPTGAPGTVDPTPDPVKPPAAKPAWTLLGDAPAPRSGHTAIYDRARDRMLVLGGGSNELWAQPFSGPNENGWERIEAGGDGPPPVGVTAIVDEWNNQLIAFASDSLDRAWALPLDGKGSWSLIGLENSPKIALGFALAMDPSGHRLFAYTSGSPEAWTLSLDGSGTWKKLAGPPGQTSFSCRDTLVYDAKNARLLVLSGGWPRGDVFALSLGQEPVWTKLNTDQAWFSYGASILFDAKGNRFLVRAADSNDWLWSFGLDDATAKWTHLKVSNDGIGRRWDASSIYDSGHDRLVMFGGRDDLANDLHNDTWALTLGDAPGWSRIGPLDDAVSLAEGTQIVSTGDVGSVLRFGGSSYYGAASLVFDAKAARWKTLGDAPTHPTTWGAGAWDPTGARLMTFGGYGTTVESQTWSFDLGASSWSQVGANDPGPDARDHHTMVHDPSGDRFLVFGGMQSSVYPNTPYFDDTWALSAKDDTWTKLDIAGPKPYARAGHAAAFDDAGHRMFVYGGGDAQKPFDDAWMLELAPIPRWTALHTTGHAPPALADHFAAYDAHSNRFFVVANAAPASSGRFDGVSIYALAGDGSLKWEHYCPQGSRPARADGAVWREGGLFVTSQGSAWRFDPSTPTCD